MAIHVQAVSAPELGATVKSTRHAGEPWGKVVGYSGTTDNPRAYVQVHGPSQQYANRMNYYWFPAHVLVEFDPLEGL